MKSLKTSIYYFLLLALPLSIISCSKEGPAGATGPAGPAGPTGATAGPAGAAGAAGTANVIYSTWLDVTFTAVTDPNDITDTLAYTGDLAVPKLTNAILTSGDVKVYYNFGTAAAPDIAPLPYFSPYFGYNIEIYSMALQKLTFVSNFNATAFGAGTARSSEFRYILIPGGQPARIMPDGSAVDWNNYSSVQKYLGLTD